MKTIDKKQRFLELRSKDYSFQKISKMINVSPRTLFYWSKILEPEIRFLKSVERQNLIASLNLSESNKIKIIGDELNKIETALKEKEYIGVPLKYLVKWKFDILKKHYNYPSLDEEIMNLYTDTNMLYEDKQKLD